MNIVLVSRTLSKLQTVAKEIEEAFNVETAVIDVDFTSGPEIYDKIKKKVQGKEIGVLVNNVGLFYSSPQEFLEIPDRDNFIQNIIRCNVTSVPMMCSLILPQMVQRKKGLVINISSVFAIIPAAFFSIYSASKAFVHKFSEDLSAEYEHQGIIVQSVLPGPVATNLIQSMEFGQGTALTPTAAKFVESAMKTIGKTSATNGYLPHSLIQFNSQFWHFLSPSIYTILTRKYFQNANKLVSGP
jgi:17beta-estradiol 17-dehydrogenase / very-long-chain 3-oxoacyl-CoA reductase